MKYNPWKPITNPVDLKYIGKLAEECGELTACISRCIIQGIDETEPTTDKLNRGWLQEEISDVLLNIELVMERFNLVKLEDRINSKRIHLKGWHEAAE